MEAQQLLSVWLVHSGEQRCVAESPVASGLCLTVCECVQMGNKSRKQTGAASFQNWHISWSVRLGPSALPGGGAWSV